MEPTRTAYGTWSGGRFMHYGEALDDEHFLGAIRYAYERGIRTFMTADVYGNGAADELLGRALAGVPRESYCLIGAVGHDFYTGAREGAKGYPRFTDSRLRAPRDYAGYLRMAVEKSLERCGVGAFDLILLHNPDATGYTSDAVWKALAELKDEGLTRQLGIAPGPANGFTLDLILSFERFEEVIDWAMIILNPLEPWPGRLCLPAAQEHGVKLITRVVDYGGLFHDDVKPGHAFGPRDHRTFRPVGWVEAGSAKLEALRPIADEHGLTMLQFASLWNLSQTPVASVIPTMIQEAGAEAKPLKVKIDELAALPEVQFSPEEMAEIERVGENANCMNLKGANPGHEGDATPDRWVVTNDLSLVAKRWEIEPERDLVCSHAPAV